MQTKLNKRTAISGLIIILLIPLTIFFGMVFLNDRSYYLVSLLIIAYTSVPFFIVFEHRKPKARELVVIAVLCAIAIAGRTAFFMVPQFKPVVAIVIIAGVCLGGESGFLIGAITGFVSNFFFGQGPWTPYQMFCFGVIGFLAGVLFSKGWLSKKKLPLSIFGAVATFFIYGGIINLASMLIFMPQITKNTILATYLSAIPFDFIHATATFVFLFFISQPMIEKIDRIKTKYGLLQS